MPATREMTAPHRKYLSQAGGTVEKDQLHTLCFASSIVSPNFWDARSSA
jgi:hypothetical protein